MAGKNDEQHMVRALQLALRGQGKTSPNPMVGAVLVKRGRVLAEGYHRQAGAPHAEIVSLRKAGAAARGATLYVTLEPCCHTGKTGPCTEAIINAGIKRVVYSTGDPNPRVSGKGARILRKAGIEVTRGLLEQEAKHLNEAYFGYYHHGQPYVILKLAQSLDGRIATRNGHSRWITGQPARKLAHQLRHDADAIIVGAGTVRRDNPSLTVRHVKGKNPFRIIVAAHLRFPKALHLVEENTDARTIIATTSEALRRIPVRLRRHNLTFWSLRSDRKGRVDLVDLIKKADDFGIRSVLVEGGAQLATSFVRENLVDKFIFIAAPKIIGDGTPSLGDLHTRSVDDAVPLVDFSVELCGRDIVVTGYAPGRKP